MVYLSSRISETENQTEDNYLFITPPHLEWLSISVNWARVSSDLEEQKNIAVTVYGRILQVIQKRRTEKLQSSIVGT